MRLVSKKIAKIAPRDRTIKICHVCGTHEHTVTRFGLRSLLPPNVEVIAGPGCPVCVTPARYTDEAIWLAKEGVSIFTFGDMFRVPGTSRSLAEAKSAGADVRIVYSVEDAVRIAKRERDKEFVFFAIGFETTAPTNAYEALKGLPDNMSLLVAHRLIPPAMELLLGISDLAIDGFICPGHVATIIGAKAFRVFAEAYKMPTVVAGFEPADFMLAVLMVLKQIKGREAKLENEYVRSVTYEGNAKAQKMIERVFEVVSADWRGIGRIPDSGYRLRDRFLRHDARLRYNIRFPPSRDIRPGCLCHLIIIGKIKPTECPLFGKTCTPDSPMGPCMVSREGTCYIWIRQGAYEIL